MQWNSSVQSASLPFLPSFPRDGYPPFLYISDMLHINIYLKTICGIVSFKTFMNKMLHISLYITGIFEIIFIILCCVFWLPYLGSPFHPFDGLNKIIHCHFASYLLYLYLILLVILTLQTYMFYSQFFNYSY